MVYLLKMVIFHGYVKLPEGSIYIPPLIPGQDTPGHATSSVPCFRLSTTTSAAVASGRPSAAHRRKGRGPRRVSPDESLAKRRGWGMISINKYHNKEI